MTLDELKRALVEVRDICRSHLSCVGCPFGDGTRIKDYFHCPIKHVDKETNNRFYPEEWSVDCWKEDSNETN